MRENETLPGSSNRTKPPMSISMQTRVGQSPQSHPDQFHAPLCATHLPPNSYKSTSYARTLAANACCAPIPVAAATPSLMCTSSEVGVSQELAERSICGRLFSCSSTLIKQARAAEMDGRRRVQISNILRFTSRRISSAAPLAWERVLVVVGLEMECEGKRKRFCALPFRHLCVLSRGALATLGLVQA
ncbi:hypothetical protein BDU57DRAFT_26761 [Ampelomyces quisqualis]|uniref:Uncharacterized protein n=1 Tax=Ampelomyces quisqualis TaxID=50730 RepID=A0A6A5R008_AMPQU|nr:hypothetical protein BDU57DRAFT_26761 [Ampelomyces quisqualis]